VLNAGNRSDWHYLFPFTGICFSVETGAYRSANGSLPCEFS